MRRILCIIGLIVAFASSSLQAQDKKTESQQKTSGGEAAKNQQPSTSYDSNGNAVDAPGTDDTPGATEAAAAANDGGESEGIDEQQAEANVPAVSQTTTSSSGSPGVLAGENGKERDGTNNVQRATMNMVGSPVRNLNLSSTTTVDADTELLDRQEYTQEKQVSANNQDQDNGANSPGQSNQGNTNNRKQNNEASDQNVSSKENKGSESEANKQKSDTRKRKKDKG